MSKCIILSRVSTSHQELDSQTKAIKNEALKEGFKEKDFIIIEDIESAIKLSEEERNGLNRMKEEIAKHKDITHVFIYELSRLSRRQLVLFSIRDFLIEHDIQLVCCTPYFRLLEEGKLSQTANLMFSIFASMAESEMALKQERMKRGKHRNKELGKSMGGRSLTGYTVDDENNIIIDEDNKQFVIDMFTMYASGQMSTMEVAEELCKRYGRIKDNPYRMRSKISKLLNNPKYYGADHYPPIISKDMFDKVKEIEKANKHNNKRHIYDTALLKKIIYDKRTGLHMTYTANSGTPRYTLKCQDHRSIVTILTKLVDPQVYQLATILHKRYVADTEKIRKELQKKIDINIQKMMNAKIKIKQIDEKMQKIEERIIYGRLTEDKAEQIEQSLIKDRKTNENIMLSTQEDIDVIEKMLKNEPSEIDYDSLTIQEKIDIIRQMIAKVEIWKESRYHPVIDVYTKVDSFLYQIHVDSWNNSSYLTSKGL